MLNLPRMAAQVTYSPLILSGDQAPGFPAGHVISQLAESPTLNDQGSVAFGGTLATGGSITTDNDTALWGGQPGAFSRYAREDDPAPGASARFRSFGTSPWIDPAGRMTFRAFLRGTGITSNNNDLGWWNGPVGGIALIAREGDPALGLTDVFYDRLDTVLINRNGQILFHAWLDGPGTSFVPGVHNDGDGLWYGQPETMTMVLRGGQPAPGTGLKFHNLRPRALRPNGAIILAGDLTRPDLIGETAVWDGLPQNLPLVIRSGMQVPGQPAGITFSHVGTSDVRINSSGRTCMSTMINTPTGLRDAVFRDDGANPLALVMKEGDPAPGTGGTFLDDCSVAGITADGGVFVLGNVSVGLRSGLWYYPPGQPGRLIWLEGSQAPGLPEGVNFGPRQRFCTNENGDLVFPNTLTGTGVTTLNDTSLWHISRDGTMTLVVREGQNWQVAPGDTRQVIGFTFSRGNAVESESANGLLNAPGINSEGKFVFQLRFSGGTHGLFLGSPQTGITPLSIISISRAAASVYLTLQVPEGRTIGIQYSEALSGWQDIGNATVSGASGSFTDTDAGRTGRSKGFYRAFTR